MYTVFIPVDEIDRKEIENASSQKLNAIKPRLQWDDNRIFRVGK